MKQMLFLFTLVMFISTPIFLFAQTTLDIKASQGNLNDIIGADTLANGTQAHDVYRLTSLDLTYKFTGTITAKGSITVVGVTDPATGRPPCIQPAVLPDGSVPPNIFTLSGAGIKGIFKNLYLLALATNNTANGGGIAIQVSADHVQLTVDNCVFDGWQCFAIGYNGNWDDFFVTNSNFRNMVHPNQWYIGEVIRNEWPGEAYTGTMSFVGNTMLCINGYAACPVTKWYTRYFEFSKNKVFYTFKNPFFLFNVTEAKINDNVFYGLYAGGVDQAENPWWDNLWNPDTTYGVISLQPLSEDNKAQFNPADPTKAEGLRKVEVRNNVYYWPKALTDFWKTWNSTQTNWVRTPNFMNEPTIAMFADNATYPYLEESGNVNSDPGYMSAIDQDVLHGGGAVSNDIGLLEYFKQIRGGTAATDMWGYKMTQVSGDANWIPTWPLPETNILEPNPSTNPLVIYADQGYLNEIIGADTLANGTQAHDEYRLVSLHRTYKFTGTITAKGNIKVVGVVDPVTGRPPCIQPAVLPDGSVPPNIFTLSGAGIKGIFKNLYLLALATNNTANGGGIAIQVSADHVQLTVDNCVFDGWQCFAIGYNGNWDDFFVTNSNFRNMVHPNQWYIGEVIRNEWPGEAYTGTMSFVNNTMLCINGYAACPVTKWYTRYFEFVGNKVLYTFKNPFFIFNVTDAKVNDNVFYGLYAGGVDQAENPWWDNLWNPDTTYGVISLQPLSEDNKAQFNPADPTKAEGLRKVEVKNNVYYWPKALTDFWKTWNSTETNWVRTPNFMNEPTIAMFADKATYPFLVESGNVNIDPGYMSAIDQAVLNGTTANDIGLLKYFKQIRSGTAATDVWGYKMTQVSDDASWIPAWPLPESGSITIVEQETKSSVPSEFALNSIYPNPFNPSVNVRYTLSKPGFTSLKVYNTLGQNVMTIIDNVYQDANTYHVSINMSEFTSGVYFCQLKQGNNVSIQKMMLLK